MADRPFPVIRMKGLTKFNPQPPLFKTKAPVIEHDAVGVKAFTIRPVYRNKLRRQVENLPELDFLPSDLFLGCLALGDIDDRTQKLDEISRSIKHRMAYAVNVPDPFIRMNDSVAQFEVHLIADAFFDSFPAKSLIIRMNPLND